MATTRNRLTKEERAARAAAAQAEKEEKARLALEKFNAERPTIWAALWALAVECRAMVLQHESELHGRGMERKARRLSIDFVDRSLTMEVDWPQDSTGPVTQETMTMAQSESFRQALEFLHESLLEMLTEIRKEELERKRRDELRRQVANKLSAEEAEAVGLSCLRNKSAS